MKSRVLTWIEYIPIKFILWMLNLFPYKRAVKAGAGLGKLVYHIPALKRVVIDGLNIAFPEKSKKEIKHLAKKVFINFGKTCFEIMKMLKLDAVDVLKLIEYHGKEEFIQDFSQGKGMVIICGHISNWELMAAGWTNAGINSDVIVRPLDNVLLDKHIEGMRKKFGMKVIPRNDSVRLGIKTIKQGRALGFLMDQNTVKNPVFVPFFGKLASAVKGPAIFAYKFKCPVGLVYSVRKSDDKHSLFYKKIDINYEITNRDEFIKYHTAIFTQELEQVIRDNPEQWLWLHPRWKTRPPSEKS